MPDFQSIQKFYSYDEFMLLMETLVANRKTSGDGYPESFVFYTKLNLQRLQRWDKTLHIVNEELLNRIKETIPQIWWVINEAWCGDASQTLPVMQKLAEASEGNVGIRIIMRDQNPAIMDQYLTNGGRSIPKLIATDLEGNELFNWGPRPAAAQKLMIDWKQNEGGKSFEEIEKDLHLWYAKDKGQSIQQELLELLS